MSKIIATQEYLLTSQVGTVKVEAQLIEGYDVEDIVSDRAISQARLVSFINLGKQVDANATLPAEALPAAFINNTEEL